MSAVRKDEYDRIDFEQVRRDNPLASVVAGSGLKLLRSGNLYKACCPFHEDRTPSFLVYPDGRWWCAAGCGSGDVIDFLARLHGLDQWAALEMLGAGSVPVVEMKIIQKSADDDAKKERAAKRIWDGTQPIGGTVAQKYLFNRGINCALPDTLRFHPSLTYYADDGAPLGEYPALVAIAVDADGNAKAVQSTYLAPDGSGKADVPKAKKARGNLSGCAIRLGDVAASLVACEGIEDGLTVMQNSGRSVWVAAGASMLPKLCFPQMVESIVIAADNDKNNAGQNAAAKARAAFLERGLNVRTVYPDAGFKDHNEQLQASLREGIPHEL